VDEGGCHNDTRAKVLCKREGEATEPQTGEPLCGEREESAKGGRKHNDKDSGYSKTKSAVVAICVLAGAVGGLAPDQCRECFHVDDRGPAGSASPKRVRYMEKYPSHAPAWLRTSASLKSGLTRDKLQRCTLASERKLADPVHSQCHSARSRHHAQTMLVVEVLVGDASGTGPRTLVVEACPPESRPSDWLALPEQNKMGFLDSLWYMVLTTTHSRWCISYANASGGMAPSDYN